MNKEIEEMAVIGCVRNPQAHTAEECAKCDFKQGQCNAYRHAEALYDAGYRKVGSDAKGNLLKIQNLCIEFDEMGYEPTTLCENPEQTAKKWKSDLMYEIGLFLDEAMGIKARYNELKAENERLKDENARLTGRLGQVLLAIDTVKEMNAMCDIDEQRKQAIKEFAERLKMKAFDKDMFNDWAGATYVVLVREIDELLKEYENGKDKD